MSKNKGKFHSKDQGTTTEPTEELVSLGTHAYEFLRPHAGKLALVLGGLCAVLVGVLVWDWYDGKQEGKATQTFGEAVEILHAKIEAPEAKTEPKAPQAKADEEKTYASTKERADAALAVLDRLDKDYGKTDVAKQSTLVKAGLFYDTGRWDEAIAAYRKAIDEASTPVAKTLAYEGLGYAEEAKALAQKDAAARTAGLEQALETFKQLQPDETGYYRDHALFHQARILALLGKKKEAIELYKKILEKFPTTSLRADVNNRLSALGDQA